MRHLELLGPRRQQQAALCMKINSEDNLGVVLFGITQYCHRPFMSLDTVIGGSFSCCLCLYLSLLAK